MKRALKAVKYLMLASGVSSPALGQTLVNGDALALQSSGAANGNGWTLSENGYVGTYIDLSNPTAVTFTVNAAGTASGGLNPDMTISIANSNESFDVDSSSLTNYTYTTPTLAAGTYFVRTQLDNQDVTANQTPDLTVGSLSVSGTGVTVVNSNNNTEALAAATTYSDNYRSGPATIQLTNSNGNALGAGTQVQMTLVSNAFNFAGAVSGISPYDDPSTWLNDESDGNVTPYSNAPNTATEIAYQKAILANFNMIVPNNAGKWVNDEYTQGSPNMNLVDAMTDFAAQNGLRVRMHNGFWDDEQPSYITSMFSSNGTFTGNLTTLETYMNDRLNYYISGDSGSLGTPRTDSYQQMDLFNELWHSQAGTSGDNANYLGALGYQGVANMYANAAADVAAAGGSTQLFTNEYNVLQFSPASISSAGVASGSDPYANWYLQGIQQIQNDGGPVSGVGMELYINPNSGNTVLDQISPAQMEEAMQNLSVDKTLSGAPASLALTEFGVASGAPNMTDYINDLTEALTMMYGTPQATTFGYWGGIGGPDANTYSLYGSTINATTDTYTLTAVGQAYEDWMANNTTENMTLTTNAAGQVSFNGTYGLYDVTIDGVVYSLDLVPGTTNYGQMVAISAATWDGNGANSNWSNSSNWTGILTGNAPVVFAGTNDLNPTNDSTAGTEYESITFNSGAGAFVIGGNAIVLGGNVVNNSSNVQTINFSIALQQNTTFDAVSGNLAFGGSISGSYGLTVVGPNSVTLSGVNSYGGATTVSSGTTLVATASGALPDGQSLVNNGTANIYGNETLGASGVSALSGSGNLNIGNGTASVVQLALNSGAATQGGLTIAANSALDITNNHLILSDPGGSIDSTIEAYLAAGYNGGGWNGASATTGSIITSAATGTTYGIGWADGATGGISGIGSGQLEIKYTLYGDTNLDGVVSGVDFGNLAANFGKSGPNIGWAQGAFTYNNSVTGVDFGLLAGNFGKSLGGAGDVVTAADWSALYAFAQANGLMSYVPEPASIGLITLGAVGVLARRRRRESAA